VVRLPKEIRDVAEKFVRVRLIKIAGMDLRRFEFDYDVTWYAFFLNADETIYGRYGGRDASDSEGRLSLAGLRYALERALEKHRNPPPPRPLSGPPLRAEDYPAARQHRGCIHCHNVNEFRRAAERAAGTWDRDSIWAYPLPENIGIVLHKDQGDRVEAVQPHSPAAEAGLQAGDRLLQLNGYPVASFADVSYALHKAPKQGSIPVIWTRGDRQFSAMLKLAPGWRKTNITWRPSLLDILPSLPVVGDDLTPQEKKALGLNPDQAVLRQQPRVHESLERMGMRGGDILIGIDGKTFQGSGDQLLAYVRRNYLVGDTITLNILRNGRRLDLRYTLK
jgi:predicted metalloprotease with PDZ domain